jgi:hypothetical protein
MRVRKAGAVAILGAAICCAAYGIWLLETAVGADTTVIGIGYCSLGVAVAFVGGMLGLGAPGAANCFGLFVGIGCLCVAADGVITGSVVTLIRRGLPASFSAGPASFLGYLAFWLALGGFLTWNALSGLRFARAKAKAIEHQRGA